MDTGTNRRRWHGTLLTFHLDHGCNAIFKNHAYTARACATSRSLEVAIWRGIDDGRIQITDSFKHRHTWVRFPTSFSVPCRIATSSERDFMHTTHGYGFSSVCVSRPKCCFSVNDLSHTEKKLWLHLFIWLS